ncbi:hypothetical protein [Streptomyces sp. NPDC055085]
MTRPKTTVASVIAEQQRINHLVGQMRIGETTVINGATVTVIDLATADQIDAQNNSPRGEVL